MKKSFDIVVFVKKDLYLQQSLMQRVSTSRQKESYKPKKLKNYGYLFLSFGKGNP